MFTELSMKRLAVLLLLGIAGFAGNWLRFRLLFGVDVLFGSFFVMLAIARYGVPAAFITGLLAASSTAFLWNHPWAIVIFTGEALFVAIANRRRPGNLMIQDTAYWLCLGIPLVWLFYHSFVGMTPQETLLIALMQSLNGIFNALLATLCIYLVQLLRSARGEHEQLVPFQQLIFMGLITVTLVPAFAHLVQNVKADMKHEETENHLHVAAVAEDAQGVLNNWLTSNHQTVIALAQLVGNPNSTPFATMQRRVEELKLANPNLLRLGVFNRQATTVAFCPLQDNTGKSNIGINFSDRPYVSIIRQTLKPYVSDVILGRIGQPRPFIMLLVAPIVVNGSYEGYCTGIVDLGQLTRQLKILTKDHATEITVVDRQGRVVASTDARRQTMNRFTRPAAGEIHQFHDGVYHWIPRTEKSFSFMQPWQDSLYVKEATLSNETPWTIIVEASMVPYLNTLTQNVIDELRLMWGMILLTIAVSHLLSKRFVVSMKRLETMTSELPQRLSSGAALEWPDSRIRELHSLISNFKAMAEALGGHIRQQQSMNVELEQRVEERTSELHASEEKYRRIVNTANEGILVLDQNYLITFVNSRLTDMLGYRESEMIGRPLVDFFFAEDVEDHAVRRFNRRAGRAERYERRLRCKNGAELWLMISAAPIQDSEQRFQGAIAMLTDITQRKLAEQGLLQLNAELEQRVSERTAELERSNKELEAFCYSISHELRAPIARLEGFSGLLAECLEHADSDTLSHLAERIGVSSQHLRSVIDSLLMINRLSRADLAVEWVDFSELARQTLAELSEGTKERSLQVKIAPGMRVQGDRRLLGICLQNLLGNALKYTGKTPQAEIEIGVDEHNVFFVKDNGAGFDMTYVNKLFQPFSRLHHASEYQGEGIGLAIVQRIIERHGGRIWVEAAPGRGATFYFTIGAYE